LKKPIILIKKIYYYDYRTIHNKKQAIHGRKQKKGEKITVFMENGDRGIDKMGVNQYTV